MARKNERMAQLAAEARRQERALVRDIDRCLGFGQRRGEIVSSGEAEGSSTAAGGRDTSINVQAF